MKKIVSLIILFSMIFGVVGCGNDAEDTPTDAKEEVTKSTEIEEIKKEDVEDEIEPKDGEPFVGVSETKMVGSYNFSTEWIPFEEPLIVDDIFMGEMAKVDDSLFILTDNKLKEYELNDNKLLFKKEFDLKDKYEFLNNDNNGVIYLSRLMSDFIAFKDGEQIFAHKGPKNVTIHPSGEWGISSFVSSEFEKVILGDGTISTEDFVLDLFKTISSVSINDNHIMISGYTLETGNQAIGIYDLDRNLEMVLGDKEFGEPDSLGSITTTIETDNGFMGIDGNMRSIYLWKPDGTFIGTLEAKEIFGTRYPWMSKAILLEDGSILIGMTEKRVDKSAEEFIVYRLNGW